MPTLKVATYNVHRCIGRDGKHDPFRIAKVLREIGADIIGLQEIDTCMFRDQSALDYLRTITGHQVVEGLVMKKKTDLFGNALLTSHPILSVRHLDLTIVGGRQRRGAIDVDLNVKGRRLRVVVVHLGLNLHERYFQIKRLIKALGTDRESPLLMMGDFNLFTSGLPRFRRLQQRLGHRPKVTTFPSSYPILPLDRIWAQPHTSLISLHAHQSDLSRIASDHLPLVGHFRHDVEK